MSVRDNVKLMELLLQHAKKVKHCKDCHPKVIAHEIAHDVDSAPPKKVSGH